MTFDTYTASLTPSLPLLPFIVSGIGLATLAVTLFLFKGKQAFIGTVIAIAIVAGGIISTIVEDVSSSHQKIERLQSWVHNEYGVSLDMRQSKELSVGKKVEIVYNNKKVLVELEKYKGSGKLLMLNNSPLPQK